eukprot:scaffold11659_cov100-Cylindrotheca_fusiformis.AAC.3
MEKGNGGLRALHRRRTNVNSDTLGRTASMSQQRCANGRLELPLPPLAIAIANANASLVQTVLDLNGIRKAT